MRAESTGFAVLVFMAAACSRDEAPAPTPAATATAAPTPAPTVSAPIPVPPPLPPVRTAPLCRVVASSSDAGSANAPVTGWLTVAAGARLTVKEPATARELILLGPARAYPCAHPAQTFLARGRFDSSLGAGESPGAEEWVVTPSAVVRYGSALVTVTVDDAGTRAVAKSGQASALAHDGADWVPIDTAHPFVAAVDPRADAGARAQQRCDTETMGVKVVEGWLSEADGGGKAFGETAVKAAAARTRVRAFCALAEVQREVQSEGPHAGGAP